MCEFNIVNFDSDLGMDIQCWLTYFDKSCNSKKKNYDWKFESISKYLKGKYLKIFLNECKKCIDYSQISEFLREKILKFDIPIFFDF